jgi:AraC family transcriptional regulator
MLMSDACGGERVTLCESGGVRLSEESHCGAVSLPHHAHTRAYFWLVVAGGYQEWYGATVHRHRALSLGFCPSGFEHENEIGRHGVRLMGIELNTNWVGCIQDLDHCGAGVPTTLADSNAFMAAMRLYGEFCRARDGDYVIDDLTAESAIAELIGCAFEPQARRLMHRAPQWFGRVVEHLDAHYADTLSVRLLAADAGVHPVHLARVFRQVHRCSMAQYQTRLRIRRACTLLGVPELTLAEIASITGFADQSHFTRAFTSCVGYPPGALRRSIA